MGQDYIRRGAIGALVVIVSLIALGFIPAVSVGNVTLRRINILSLVLDTPVEKSLLEPMDLELDEEEYDIDLDAVASELEQAYEEIETIAIEIEEEIETIPKDTIALEERQPIAPIKEVQHVAHIEHHPKPKEYAKQITGSEMVKVNTQRLLPQSVVLTPIENFDTLEYGKLDRFYRKLSTKGSTTRIAVLGDSFIEGDILTSDLRESLQRCYGGCGAGFTPMSSPLTKYRQTIKCDSRGWKSYNIMKRRSSPEKYASNWAVSGWICEPTTDGASVKWSCTDNRELLDSCSRVRLIFMSRESSEISVALNGGEPQIFSVSGSERLQHIELSKRWISSCEMKVLSGASGFVGYGAIFEGDGVVVDNYSIRSNNGQAMLWTNPTINAQIDGIVGGYDMVVLQYGLNILQRGVKNYSSYAEQIEKMITFARLCFPRAAIMVMGVSDRSMHENGRYEPITEAADMTAYQQQAAQNMGAAFWNTLSAMEARGGMVEFVANNWAAKDFTHINFEGGRQIGKAIAEAINVARHEAYPPIVEKKRLFKMVKEGDLRGLKYELQGVERDRVLEEKISFIVDTNREPSRRKI
ncbi:MAG: hypothetical protein SNH55_07225 [Rikenellaceae bacterium]